APGCALVYEVAAQVARTPRSVKLLRGIDRRIGAALERLTAQPDGVDLVDEDDALPAPLAGELLRLPSEEAHDERIDADERLRESGAADRDERRVEPGRDRLCEHRLAGARCSEEEQSAFALAAGALERLAGLPQRDDSPNLFLRLDLAAHVVELHAPLGVARLVPADLRNAHEHQRPHEDQEVRQEE